MRYGIGEVFDFVSKATSDEEKISILKKNDCNVVREVCKMTFDPDVVWNLPETDPPFKKSQLPAGMGDTNLAMEWKRMYLWVKGPNHPEMHQGKREQMFIGLLESLDVVEQDFLVKLKNKKIKGLEEKHVRVAFPGLLPTKSQTIIKEVKKAVKRKSNVTREKKNVKNKDIAPVQPA